ncbi:MAG: UDP-3-O-(3-hydroxymyristoyl)glucosamine N-acyltransferase [Methylocystis sp.]|nr:UDP-3-O-(3-hydroxymyristoyl)glucosamine N-acyltransferase [Methylocystis sp.]MCA3584085.1 UDP-3-O-(3-hydroxymyristoyl)glucosamine N-acyltransferase [Methylocystis sp.]MCA3588955.1 UDP-3-O-(3-hydroxymyristoyl)glucosamine N-acyltransferase [Methylocystis sp.]MCA3591205.1 UDP-3-O-(3-hydroxymyristoyl)glucosamine N-acyltransferase [Methylocystis sp.]
MTAFFPPSKPLSLGEIASLAGATLPEGADPAALFDGIGPLDGATARQVTFLDNPQYVAQAALTRAGVCIIGQRHAGKAAAATVSLVAKEPYRAFARVAAAMFPQAMRPQSLFGAKGVSAGAFIHPDARLEQGVVIDPGVVVGPGAEIGSNTVICANAVIGPGVTIGRDSAIGPNVSLAHAHLGNRVIIHAGCNIGQDGFGFAMSPQGHLKVPQVGRVIIQDDVEIGSGACVDRGMNRDTLIGEGTKIDNLVQVGHNVTIGRHCVIVAQVALAGSSKLEDFVVIGGQSGVIGHATVGMGAQIAATSAVGRDVPPGQRWGGTPAKPIKELFREMAAFDRIVNGRAGGAKDSGKRDGEP